MKDRELAKALEAGERLQDLHSSTAEYRYAVLKWDSAANTAKGLLKNRQDRDDRVKRNHVSKKRRDD